MRGLLPQASSSAERSRPESPLLTRRVIREGTLITLIRGDHFYLLPRGQALDTNLVKVFPVLNPYS